MAGKLSGLYDRGLWMRVAETLAIGVAGGGLLELTGMPAGWLCGSMLAVIVAVFAGRPLKIPDRLRSVAFILLGASMGAVLSPEMLSKLEKWPVSIFLLALSVIATMVVGTQYLARRHHWDGASARLSSVPGALSAVLAIASDSRGDLMRITVSQTLRQIVLVCLVPILLLVSPAPPEKTHAILAGAGDIVLMLAAASVGGLFCARLRIPGGLLLGALLGSGILHATGVVSGVLPGAVLIAAYVIVGSAIGARLRGTNPKAVIAVLRPAVGSIAAAIVIAAIFAALASFLTGLPFNEVWLAFAPGGVEAMTVLAFALNLDPGFVSGHHLIRLVGLMLLSPLWTAGLRRGA
ncbi:AbrB family transcriptional regulator (plasmid) [Rhizobium sp. NIBRBAC000502774]|nr:AbrB family transcriptional regulator [Rhizobium sp. NIBRBAC000502774]